MRKTLFCGVDLHSNNAMYVITDSRDKQLFKRRLPNQLPIILESLEPFRQRLKVVAVESTYNWYWLVDGLRDREYPVVLANPSEMDQYHGIKEADDLTDAAFLARLARLEILPTGYIYPKEDRPVRDLLRRRMLVVQQRTGIILSLQNMAQRQTGQSVGWRTLRTLSDEERTDLLGDHDCLAFVTAEQVDLIELLTEKIRRFEKKVLEHAALQPAYAGDGGHRAVRDGRGLHVLLPLRTGHTQFQRQEEGPQQRQERQPLPGVGLRGGRAPCPAHVPAGQAFLR
jgi:transposase